MIIPKPLRKGDKVAIVSLSSGMLGEAFCAHTKETGIDRLRRFGLEPVFTENALRGTEYLLKHPETRAADLKEAFLDDSVKAIITAIGGVETFRTIPYLMEDDEFKEAVRRHPKIFLGFSDTTHNHFMLRRLGLQTYYGQAFICDIAELSGEMLPYSEAQFESLFTHYSWRKITPSDIWYNERNDFSPAALGTMPASNKGTHGYELLQGAPVFEGELLGGCVDSMGEMLLADAIESLDDLIASECERITGLADDFRRQAEIIRKYNIFPSAEEWVGKIFFAETSEVAPNPDTLRRYLKAFKAEGVFEKLNGIIVGKPIDEKYYEEYKDVWREGVGNSELPILYNVNIGHATPRVILPYGAKAHVDAEKQEIILL